MNALQDWFDDDNDLPRSNDRERFDKVCLSLSTTTNKAMMIYMDL